MYSQADAALIRKARELVRELREREAVTLLPPRREIQYSKRGTGPGPPKRKGGGPPSDFTAIDILIDLEALLQRPRPNPDHVLPLYLHLRSLVGGF